MDAQQRSWHRLLLAPLLLLTCFSAVAAQAAPALPLAVRDGRCEFVLPTEHFDDQCYLVIGSLARQGGPFRVRVRTAAVATGEVLPLEIPVEDQAWTRRMRELSERLRQVRQQRSPAAPYPPAAEPLRQKVFWLLTGQGSLADPANYTAVTAELRAAGRHCQVYVDRDYPNPGTIQPTVDDAVRTFDDTIHPEAERRLGHVLDVDRDGRFTMLFTPWLGKLQSGRIALGGFVRGSDFYRDVAAPFSNNCDMMYLNTALLPGAHLRTLLAHEYTHAVIFCEHVLGAEPSPDEESWLNEGLAHLVETVHGFSWSNLDYRISAFLSAPEQYPLVVADYYGTGLWRNPGTRGAAYLFLRWCRDRYGVELPTRLIQSNLAGVANLEAATQERFAALFRQWSVALLSREGGAWGKGGDNASTDAPPFGRLLCGPRVADVPLAQGDHEISLAGTAAAFLCLHSPAGTHARVTITAEAAAELQVSLIPPARSPSRLGLRAEVMPGGAAVRLFLSADGGAVELEDAAWERLVPSGNAREDTSFQRAAAPQQTVWAWFGDPHLLPGDTRKSCIIAVPDGKGPLVWKVLGKDGNGQPVAAWCVLPASAPLR
jgi:hypothetical protein